MPFEPLTPEEQRLFPEPCRNPQHYPPSHYVVRKPMAWVCPGCGQRRVIRPARLEFLDDTGGTPMPWVRFDSRACH